MAETWYQRLVNLKQAVTHGDRRATIGAELREFAAQGACQGLPRATLYGCDVAGRALQASAADGSHSVEFGFPDDVYHYALGQLDCARDALAHAMGEGCAVPIRKADTCAGCGEYWPCSDSKRTDIRPDLHATHYKRD